MTYVLDTNVLILSPTSIFTFDEHNVVITDITIEELDGLKKAPGEVGANARETSRIIDEMRVSGDLMKGVKLPSGGMFRIETNHVSETLPDGWAEDKPDNRILRAAKALTREKGDVVLVTGDTTMRIKSDVIGVTAQEYRTEISPAADDQYKGKRVIFAEDGTAAKFVQEHGLFCEDLPWSDGLFENEFVEICEKSGVGESVFGKVKGEFIFPLEYVGKNPAGIVPRNKGQVFALEALLEPAESVPLVILKGNAGTAKTFCALAAAVDQTIVKGRYKRILLVRPSAEFDDEIGFLPGDEMSKIGPLLRPAIDNLEIIAENLKNSEAWRKYASLSTPEPHLLSTEEFVRSLLLPGGAISAQAMNFMRGRSIVNQYIVIDEAQNMTPSQAIGLITRVGERTKIVLCGDVGQIDNPRLDSRTNGLSYASEAMKGSPLCAQLTFEASEGVRSKLATDAAARMQTKGEMWARR
jgi:PhoH-like ATPase